MRLRQSAALVVAAATSAVVFPAFHAAAETAGTTLYVNRLSGSCTDTGSGAEAAPFCSVSAAAAVVEPGQTVQVVPGTGFYQESVTLTRSGTPERPITFQGVSFQSPGARPVLRPASGSASAFVLTGVHDVVVRGFQVRGYPVDQKASPLVVRGSSRISLDQNEYATSLLSGVDIAGDGSEVTVSRSRFAFTGGVSVGAGSRRTLITANEFNRSRTRAVAVTDAPGTVVTNNTIAFSCGESVRIDGASPGAVVENNVISAEHGADTDVTPAAACSATDRGEAEIAVSAGSVGGSKVDYNLVHPWADGSAYAWAGTGYPTAAAFGAAVPGQAGHDIDLDVSFNPNGDGRLRLPDSATAAIDSTDPTAPGVDTDILGSGAVDHPGVPNTGAGVRDRGAFESVGQRSVKLTVTAGVRTLQGPAPFAVSLTAAANNAWNVQQANYRFVFGDGTTLDSPVPTVSHTYTIPGVYNAFVTATDTLGTPVSSESTRVDVRPAGNLTAELAVRTDEQLGAGVTVTVSSPYAPYSNYFVSFGDRDNNGDGQVPPGLPAQHQYSAPGTYEITAIVNDESLRQTVVHKTVTVSSAGYTASLAAGERVQLFGFRADNGQPVNAGTNYTQGRWAPFLPVRSDGRPSGRAGATASVITQDQYLRSFWLGSDSRIHFADRNLGPNDGTLATGQWGPWSELTAADRAGALPGVTQLTATTIGSQVHLVAVAGGRVYETHAERGLWQWTRWGDVTGALGFPADVTGVAAASTGNVVHVAMLSRNGRIRVADGDYNRGRWGGGDLTAQIGGLPAIPQQLVAAVTPGSRFQLAALVDGKIHQTTGDYASGGWSGWGNVSNATSMPDATRLGAAATGNSLHLFALTTDGALVTADGDYTAGRWSPYRRVDSPSGTGTVDPFGTTGLDVFSVAGR
ncbi:PKD domain-containing protein [Kitasatospora sp. SolWspMP-SS2h]|uniref:PKD domain-containing protein n=1 Tax=Kitasatospora sp. SolWspMP-SS2h TaxID=1305729 RepID=UPI000DC02E36|nr:PKD domain-containing protein [Kitasatospora sp. SolWspMP-SS2h]RAJ42664.1 PKD domain-containing protein [Kitasatospora sp. SolWspMP-SS2h]